MKYSIILLCVVFVTLVGCTSQTSNPSFGDDFDQKKAAKTRVSLGLTYLKNGNFSQAKYNLDKALEFAPRSADAHYGLAYYYQTVGEMSAAENAYQTAMDFEPNNADIANSYGAFLCQSGKYPKAKEYFLKAINNSSYISSAETYENLALCSQSQGYQADASEYLRSAVNHQPGRAKSLFLLTQSLVIEKKWLEARDVLRKYEKVAQISADTLLLSSRIERELGNISIAASYGDMLLKIYPDSAASKRYKEELLAQTSAALPVARKSIKLEVPKQPAQSQPALVPQNETVLVLVPAPQNETGSATVPVPQNETVSALVPAPQGETESAPQSETESALVPAPQNETESELVPAPQNEKGLAVVPAPQDETVSEVVPLTVEEAETAENKPTASTETLAVFHEVKSGENLYRISLQYNIKMQRLIEWNGLNDASDIYAGKKLRLVSPDSASLKE